MTLNSFIKVTLPTPDDFHKVRETLSRIGVASQTEKILYQSCHILHKRGLYYICHFKELFLLDGKPSTLTDSDLARRNTIAKLLEDSPWAKQFTLMSVGVMNVSRRAPIPSSLLSNTRCSFVLRSQSGRRSCAKQ
jgi:hypothetical protein